MISFLTGQEKKLTGASKWLLFIDLRRTLFSFGPINFSLQRRFECI